MQVRVASLFALLTLAAATSASASLVSSTGSASVIAPPADVRVNMGLESDTSSFFFTEMQGLTLTSAVAVNISSSGLYSSNASLTPGSISSGTTIDSYYLHTDPVGAPSNDIIFDGSLTFDTDILGVIVLDAQFAASNAELGNPGTLYSSSGQGLELGGPDTVDLSISGRTLTYHLGTSTAADDIRIITAADVPEPGSLALVAVSLGALAMAGRRRTQSSN